MGMLAAISLPTFDSQVSFLFCKPGVFREDQLEQRDRGDLAAFKIDITFTADSGDKLVVVIRVGLIEEKIRIFIGASDKGCG